MRVRDTSAQNSVHVLKSTLAREHSCSMSTNAVPRAWGCDECELKPPYVLATSQQSLACQVDF